MSSAELDSKQGLFLQQLLFIAILIGFAILVWLIEWISPSFFDFPYLQPTSVEKILHFWPLLLYAIVMTVLFTEKKSTPDDEALLAWGLVTSTLAGLWEEFGFRCIYVCTAMVGIAILNWCFAAFGAFVVAVIIIAIGVFIIMGGHDSGKIAEAFSCILGAAFIVGGLVIGWKIFRGFDPWYWIYDHIFVTTVNIVTLGSFSSIFRGDYPRVFVFGMVAANAGFRDGHKYQGPFGIVNSWIVGFVMMYATMTYGLWTAIALHVLYDVEIDFVLYTGRKLSLLSVRKEPVGDS